MLNASQWRHAPLRWGSRWRVVTLAAATALALPLVGVGQQGVATAQQVSGATTVTCAHAPQDPFGTIPPGTYASLVVNGNCAVDQGAVTVTGNLTVNPGETLVAAFSSPSTLTVNGDVIGNAGSVVLIGCKASSFGCLNDPNQEHPTLNGPARVGGDLTANGTLATIVHNVTIGGDARQIGGGGGVTCTPPGGILGAEQTPAYTDFEDTTIGGNLWVTGLRTCWLGTIRDQIAGSATFSNNHMADPDAGEIVSDVIAGNMICTTNQPAPHFGDSGGHADVVGGYGAGQCAFSVKQPNPAPDPGEGTAAGPLENLVVPSTSPQGYVLGGQDGGVFTFGAGFFGSAAGTAEILPYVGTSAAPGGRGYWVANGTGRVIGFGPNARALGDASALTLKAFMVGVSAAPGGDGYYLAASDGGVFNYGPGTSFQGSAGALPLQEPVVGIAAAPTGQGYYLVARDGGVFAYGPGAPFEGSAGNIHLAEPIVGMAVDPVTGGYWLVGSDGGVFSYNAPFYGSAATLHLAEPIVGISAAPHGNGYYLVGEDGGIFTYGPGATFQGSAASLHLNQPVNGIAAG